MSPPTVYFAELPPESSLEQRLAATERILASCGLPEVVAPGDRTALGSRSYELRRV
jgi:hypothetical protein